MGLLRVDLFASIRRDKRLDPGLSQGVLAEKYGVHRRTVKQALESALPPPRKTPRPRVTVLEPANAWTDAMLREDLMAPRKQKHTARRVQQRGLEGLLLAALGHAPASPAHLIVTRSSPMNGAPLRFPCVIVTWSMASLIRSRRSAPSALSQ